MMSVSADSVVESELDSLLGKVAHEFDGDALCWYGSVAFGVDTVIRRVIETRRKTDKSKQLVILITTTGGIVEVVQRAVSTVRHHYDIVNFVVPDFAYSAGTVFVLSGDSIFMDYHSRLGPIDPQLFRGDRFVPALGYCERYDALIKQSAKRDLTDAEIAVLIGSFNQAELSEFEHARELSITLLRDWLVRYKFKNWTKTEARGNPVTEKMKKTRARSIAKSLSNTARWHSHAAGISADVLRDELNLKIDDFGDDSAKATAIAEYQALLEDYMGRRNHLGVIHMRGQFLAYHSHGY